MKKIKLEQLTGGELLKKKNLTRTFIFNGFYECFKLVGVYDTIKNEWNLINQNIFLQQFEISMTKKAFEKRMPLKNQDVIDFLEIHEVNRKKIKNKHEANRKKKENE